MSQNINRLRNPRFSSGRDEPRHWSWNGSAGATLSRATNDAGERVGIAIDLRSGDDRARIEQRVGCVPGEYYRVEAVLEANLRVDDEHDGCALTVASTKGTQGRMRGAVITDSGGRLTLRAYYHAPPEVREVLVGLDIAGAEGAVRVEEMRFIRILEPEEEAHMMAIGLPDHALPIPRQVRRVTVCSASATSRPITERLRTALGVDAVATVDPGAFQAAVKTADALLLPDSEPPKKIKSLRALLELSAERIVVISLPAFAKLAGAGVRMRRVEQPDDPIHARVMFANHATRGFVLQDAFPFAWAGSTPGSFVQRQFRKTKELSAFCRKHGFEVMLDSLCDKDSTSNQPVCLYRERENGALVVLDIEPMEEEGSSFAEPTLPLHFLLSLVGHGRCGLGQYAVPHVDEADFRSMIRESAVRYRGFRVLDEDVPVEKLTDQLVLIGGEDESFGLPIKTKPLILVRSGLSLGDMVSVYGAYLWFKQLVRMEPFVCPYATALCSRFRLAWIPLVAAWPGGRGWSDIEGVAGRAYDLAFDDAPVAAVIDIRAHAEQSVRVTVGGSDAASGQEEHWLPRLWRTFPPGRFFSRDVPPGATFSDRREARWGHVRPELSIERHPDVVSDDVQRAVVASGGQVVRLEIPGWAGDFASQSIQRTAMAATLLEQVVGLHYGLIAVNRLGDSLSFETFGEVAPGQALIVDRKEARLRMALPQAG